MDELAITMTMIRGTNLSATHILLFLLYVNRVHLSFACSKKADLRPVIRAIAKDLLFQFVSRFIIFFVFLIRLWNAGYLTYFCLPAIIERVECENGFWGCCWGGRVKFFCNP